MVIETYWNDLGPINPTTGLTTVVHDRYVCKSRLKTTSGWKSLRDFRRYARKSSRFLGEDEQGRFKFDLGSSYGIHSYQLVSFPDGVN